MNTFLRLVMVLLAFSGFSLNAEETAVEYTSPNEIASENWVEVRGEIATYNECLRREMVAKVENGNDARQVSNDVLEACSFHLLDLQKDMKAMNLDPNFVDRYIYTNKNKSARKMLGAIMVLMSQQQDREARAAAEAEGSQAN